MIGILNRVGAAWWSWVVPLFWQVGLLAVLVWTIDLVLRRRGWPQVRYALWLLVLLRLVIPPAFSLPTSVSAPVIHAGALALARLEPHAEPSPEPGSLPTQPVIDPNSPRAHIGFPPVTPASVTSVQRADGARSRLPVGLTSSRREYLSPVAWAMLLAAAGSVLFLCWVSARTLRTCSLVGWETWGRPAPRWAVDVAADCAQKLGLRRVPRVVVTDRVPAAAVLGVFRPVLLLPKPACAELLPKQISHIVLHEMAHVKRGDLVANAVQTLLQIAFWFHPMVWVAAIRLRHLREMCCDATVAAVLREQTGEYRATLAETARRMVFGRSWPTLGLLGLFENPSRIRMRLDHLVRPVWKHARLRISVALTVFAAMVACVVPMTGGTASAEPPLSSADGWIEIGTGSATAGGISNTGEGTEARYPVIGTDADGYPVVCWYETQPGAPGSARVYIKRWDGIAWVELGAGSASGDGMSDGLGIMPVITTDNAGKPIVGYLTEVGDVGINFIVAVKRWTGTQWDELPGLIDLPEEESSGWGGAGGACFDIAIASDGNPVVCWSALQASQDEDGLAVKHWNGTGWVQIGESVMMHLTQQHLALPRIAMDLAGSPVVCWIETPDYRWGPASDYFVYAKRWDGSQWVQLGGNVSGDTIMKEHPDIAMGWDGNPIVCYTTNEGPIQLRVNVRRWDGSQWVNLGENPAPNWSRNPAIVIGNDGNPILSWESTSLDIYVRKWDAVRAEWVEIGGASGSGGGISDDSPRSDKSSIALDWAGNPIVCWESGDESDDIYVRGYFPYESGSAEVATYPQQATWTLSGPGGYSYDGSGNEILTDVVIGIYALTWHPLPGYDPPSSSPEAVVVSADQTVSVSGSYIRHRGTVWVNTDPDAGTWSLNGPDYFSVNSSGNGTVTGVPTGECTVTWLPLSDYEVPANSPETRTVTRGSTTTFTGHYPLGPGDLALSVTGITWSDEGRTATISYKASEPVKGSYYYRLYQTQSTYTRTDSTAMTFEGLEDGYYLFVATARDELGRFAPEPCRVWFINRTWGEEFQVYVTSYTVYGNVAWLTYAATEPCSVYYVRLHDAEDGYTRTTSTTTCCRNVSDGIHYFVVTGKEEATGQFPSCGPGRQFFYVGQ